MTFAFLFQILNQLFLNRRVNDRKSTCGVFIKRRFMKYYFCLPPFPLLQPPLKMEAQKEKSQSSSLLKDRISLSDERLSDASLSRDNSDVRQRLSVKRNSQLNSISPTLHKVQFAAIDGDDENDKPAVNGPLIAADTYSSINNSSSQQHLNNNNNNDNDNSTEVDESGVFSTGRSPEKSPKSSSWRDKNGKRRRTLSEASYFSATSTMSAGSASSSSSSSSG